MSRNHVRVSARGLMELLTGKISSQEWNDHEHEKQHPIVQRPDPQTSPGVKVSEVAFRSLRVEKDARDQQAGQDGDPEEDSRTRSVHYR